MCVVREYPWNLGGPGGSVCVGRGCIEGRLQAPLMVLVGEKSGGGSQHWWVVRGGERGLQGVCGWGEGLGEEVRNVQVGSM